MASAAAKGQLYKARTKRWLERQGYQVAFLERMIWFPRNGRWLCKKEDQLGADLLAVSATEAVLVQAKLGRKGLAEARREFRRHAVPPSLQRWIVSWAPRAREPQVEVVGDT